MSFNHRQIPSKSFHFLLHSSEEFMNTLDIYKIANMLVTSEFTWLWCAMIFVYAGYWLLYLVIRGSLVNHRLSKIVRSLFITSQNASPEKSPEDRLHKLDLIINQTHFLSASWVEFKKAFVAVSYETMHRHYIGKSPRNDISTVGPSLFGVQALKPASEYFNEDLLSSKAINFNAAKAIPGHLTGLGILGTFVGLSAGVFLAHEGLLKPEISSMQEALAQLLGGASLAFFTSVAGILTALLFSKYENSLFRRTTNSFKTFINQLEHIFTTQPIESCIFNQWLEQRNQTDYLKTIASDIGTMITNSLKLNEKLVSQTLQEFKKSLHQETKHELEGVVSALKDTATVLQTNCASLKEANELFSKTFKDSASVLDKFSKSASSYIDQSNEAAKEFKATLCKVSPEFNTTVQNLSKINQSLNGFHNSICDSQEKAQKNIRIILDSFDETGEKINRLLNADVFGPIKHFVSSLDQCTKMVIERMDKAAHIAINQLKSPLDHFTRGIALFAKTTISHRKHLERIEHHVRENLPPYRAATDELTSAEHEDFSEADGYREALTLEKDVAEKEKNEEKELRDKWNSFSERYFEEKKRDLHGAQFKLNRSF